VSGDSGSEQKNKVDHQQGGGNAGDGTSGKGLDKGGKGSDGTQKSGDKSGDSGRSQKNDPDARSQRGGLSQGAGGDGSRNSKEAPKDPDRQNNPDHGTKHEIGEWSDGAPSKSGKPPDGDQTKQGDPTQRQHDHQSKAQHDQQSKLPGDHASPQHDQQSKPPQRDQRPRLDQPKPEHDQQPKQAPRDQSTNPHYGTKHEAGTWRDGAPLAAEPSHGDFQPSATQGRLPRDDGRTGDLADRKRGGEPAGLGESADHQRAKDPEATLEKSTKPSDAQKNTGDSKTPSLDQRTSGETNPYVNDLFYALSYLRVYATPEAFHKFMTKYETTLFPILRSFGYEGSRATPEATAKDFDRTFFNWQKTLASASSSNSPSVEVPRPPSQYELRQQMWQSAANDPIAALVIGLGAAIEATIGKRLGFEQDPAKAAAGAQAISHIAHIGAGIAALASNKPGGKEGPSGVSSPAKGPEAKSSGSPEAPPKTDLKPDVYTHELFRSKTKGPANDSGSRGYDRRSDVHQEVLDRAIRWWGKPGPAPDKKDLDLGHRGTPLSRLPPKHETTLMAQEKGENRSIGASEEKAMVKKLQERSKELGLDPHDPSNPYYTRPKRK
jgi:hypothetical protein